MSLGAIAGIILAAGSVSARLPVTGSGPVEAADPTAQASEGEPNLPATKSQPATSLPAALPLAGDLPAAVAPVVQCCTLPALTPLRIEIRTPINSKLVKIGEHFVIRLADPIDVGDVHLQAGIEGSGDVVHAAKSGFAGRPGELILAVRYLDVHGTRIPLRSLTFIPGRGKDQTTAAVALAVAAGAVGAVIAMFITGGEVDIPVGTTAYAKTAAPVLLLGRATVTTELPLQQGSLSQ